MNQGAGKDKPGGGKDAQPTDKDKKTSEDKKTSADNPEEPDAACKQLVEFMKGKYDEKVKDVETFDEFYHAFYELIEMYCEHNGQFQYRMPKTDVLREEYQKVVSKRRWGTGGKLTPEEFDELAKGILKVSRFSFGAAAFHMLACLFGVPVCAVFTKRFIPGLKSVSDDIVIPAATSGVVLYLTKAKKL